MGIAEHAMDGSATAYDEHRRLGTAICGFSGDIASLTSRMMSGTLYRIRKSRARLSSVSVGGGARYNIGCLPLDWGCHGVELNNFYRLGGRIGQHNSGDLPARFCRRSTAGLRERFDLIE